MKYLLAFISLLSGLSYAQEVSNFYGGFYSSQADAAVARVGDASSPMQNPAGLRKIRREEISSGASSFSLKRDKSKKGLESSSSALHVSYIRGFENFNIGGAIYTVGSSFRTRASFNDNKNSEGLPYVNSETSISKTENTYYSLAIAPKNSSWGASVNLLQFDQAVESTYYSQSFSNSDPSKRRYQSSSSKTEFNLILAGLSFGLQKDYGPISFGINISSPFYLLSQKNNAVYHSIAVGGNGANDAYISNNHFDYEPELRPGKIIPERLKAGIAYKLDRKWQFEFDYQITSAAKANEMKSSPDLYAAFWQVQANDYQETPVTTSTDDSSNYSKAEIRASIGAEYFYSKGLRIGMGALYQPTSEKDNTGIDIFQFTTGVSRYYKNYKGAVSIAYTQARDAGNNIDYAVNAGEDQKLDMSFEELGLLLSGSYYF